MKRFVLFVVALSVFSSAAYARKVSGIVTAGDKKLKSVIVTDGKNFTRTGKSGRFSFEIADSAEFVYIVTPSGYVADWSSGVPAFYQRTEGRDRFVFDLIPTWESDDYSIIAMADPQCLNDAHFEMFAGEPMEDMCETVGRLKNAVGLALGDICWDNMGLLERYKAEIVRTGIPFYPVVGNHDHSYGVSEDLESTAVYRRIMGPENYAFFVGKDVVIALDNIIYRGKGLYREGYSDDVLAWVKGLETLLPDDADLYIAQHSPVKAWGNMIVGSSDLLDIVRGRKVTFLSGHVHVNMNFEYEKDITEHNVAALCGSWWDIPYCTDGTPGGYKVFVMEDGKLEWYYKSVAYPESFQMELFRPGETVMHPESFVLNIWDWTSAWKVEWYEDGRRMGFLEPEKDYSPTHTKAITAAFDGKEVPAWKRSSLDAHYFAATPSPAARNVTISVENPFGRSWTYVIELPER